MRILIADDEKDMRDILKAYFEKEGYEVTLAENGRKVIACLVDKSFDLIILDWMMPYENGIDICYNYRNLTEAKILMLTAKTTVDDELAALRAGADDYLRKPFDPRILVLRVKKLLKDDCSIMFKDLKIDTKARKCLKDNVDLELTAKEYTMLLFFIQNKGVILERQQLIDKVWGVAYDGDPRTLDTHIKRLRDKIGGSYIKTYRGMGYSLEE